MAPVSASEIVQLHGRGLLYRLRFVGKIDVALDLAVFLLLLSCCLDDLDGPAAEGFRDHAIREVLRHILFRRRIRLGLLLLDIGHVLLLGFQFHLYRAATCQPGHTQSRQFVLLDACPDVVIGHLDAYGPGAFRLFGEEGIALPHQPRLSHEPCSRLERVIGVDLLRPPGQHEGIGGLLDLGFRDRVAFVVDLIRGQHDAVDHPAVRIGFDDTD